MKVDIKVGYTHSNLGSYTYWSRKNLVGTDVLITDGNGNKIEIGSREKGSLITVNGKVIKEMD
jgi:hypothetical protein